MKLSIVTINTRKKDLTIQCIRSVYDLYKKQFEEGIMELIIVDNNSGDDSVPAIRTVIDKKKNCKLVESKDKLGFGPNNNLGVKKAKGEIILFLNNDTIVKGGLDDMLAYLLDHAEIAILGGPLKNFDGSPQASAGVFYTPLRAFMLLVGFQKYGLLDKSPLDIRQVDWVKGALLMIRRSVFDELHGFDEKIFMYTEDMELCYRAMLKGYKTYFYPSVIVLHKDQGSSNRTFAIVNIYQNLGYFYRKHRPYWEYLLLKSMLRSKAWCLIVWGKITHNTYLVSTYEQALAVS